MSQSRTLRAGVFLPPFHPNDEDPLLCMERDFELMRGSTRTITRRRGSASTIPGVTRSTASPNCSLPPPSAPGTSGSAPG